MHKVARRQLFLRIGHAEPPETAVNHLHAIHEYVAQTSTIYADRLIDRLTRRSQQIRLFPGSGRIVPDSSEMISERS